MSYTVSRFAPLLILLGSWSVASGAGAPKAATGSPEYVPFPDGYGYMENLTALQQATDTGDRKTIREHGWSLWAGIRQPVPDLGWPVWFTWPNTYGAFQPDSSAPDLAPKTKAPAPSKSITASNKANAPDVDTPAPIYPVPQQVIDDYPKGICKDHKGEPTVCYGKTFVNNGEIMIATESLSKEAMDDIRNRLLYLQEKLTAKHDAGTHMIEVVDWFIVTKHMYWPVSATGVSPLPVWNNDFGPEFTGYAGYETWKKVVAVDPTGKAAGEMRPVSFLFGVKNHDGSPMPTKLVEAPVYSIEDFYYHKVTEEDWKGFSDADKANLNAASNWSYDRNFGIGDYLVTVAMHVNTKELPSWTLQSLWWSDTPDEGPYASYRPDLPQAQGPWQHYLMTDSYAVPPNDKGELDIAVNPYIEGVIHPIATSCRNCHVRAGWPTGRKAGKASYQNPDCPGLLTYLTPDSGCLESITLTDYLWIIPDRAID